jgi:hypothetical protein
MKKLLLTVLTSLGLVISYPALADVEYYHCEEGVDKYWKFDTDILDSVSPEGGAGALWSTWSGIIAYPITSYDKEWFKVEVAPSIGLTHFISRVGKPSLYRVDTNTISLGVCKRMEESVDILERFLTKAQKDKLKKDSKPLVQNWN